MNQFRIKAVVFDLGNVLIDFDHAILIRRILPFTGLSEEALKAQVAASGLTERFEKGEMPAEDFYVSLKRLIKLRLDYPGFVKAWNEIFFFSPANREVLKIVSSLNRRYAKAVLTNTNSLHLAYVRSQYPILENFDKIIASCEVGFRKPECEIYQKTCAALGVLAQEIFYCDDQADLVEAALAAGIDSVVYRTFGQLKSDLLKRGILS